MQCAKCHDHKFEPLSQRDYYQWQSVFYPAFNIEDWVKPNERFVQANLPGELEAWQAHEAADRRRNRRTARASSSPGRKSNRRRGAVLFHDEFGERPAAGGAWSNTAPGDDQPAGCRP